jgi:hypothetical protein
MIQKKFGTILFSDSRCQKQANELQLDKTGMQKKNDINVPETFDGREIWKDYMNPIDYQSSCISCWAFTSLFVLASRLAIYTKGQYNFKFSVAKMIFQKNNLIWDKVKNEIISGIPFDYRTKDKIIKVNTCSENSLLDAWQYLYSFGVPEDRCVNDRSRIDNAYSPNILFGDSYDQCPVTKEEMIHHRVGGYYYVPGTVSKSVNFPSGNEANIRRDIYHWGPCTSAMRIFKDFLEWDGVGIYKWDGFSEQVSITGHSVVIIGWGEENGQKYWIVRNSWGDDWGVDKGYFKIVRGLNNCEIEENVFVGFPTLPAFKMFLEHPVLYRFDDFILRGKWGIMDNGYKLTSYEKIIFNKDPKFKDKINDFIYNMKYWPDFSKLIAAELSTIIFNVKEENKLKENFDLKENYICKRKDNFENNIIIFIILLIIVKMFLKKSKII